MFILFYLLFLLKKGGTVDITIHETQRDHTVRELFKANGGPWGGTKIDEAFINFLTDITGPDVMEIFQRFIIYD